MILEFKKYALLAFLFVGFTSVSVASCVVELTAQQFAEKIAQEEAKAKDLESTLEEQSSTVKLMEPAIAVAEMMGQDPTEAKLLLAETKQALKELRVMAKEQRVYVESLKAAARQAAQDLVAVAVTAGVTSEQRDAALRDGSLCAAFLISPKDSSKCGYVSCQKSGTQLCSGCRQVFYCSKECQSASWKAHKAKCKELMAACEAAQAANAKK